MYNRSGRGRGLGRGSGGGMGFGFRGASPPWPYVGLGRGGLPRCGYFFSGAGAPARWPYQPPTITPQMTKDEELGYLKDQAEAIKGQLGEIETRIKQLTAEKE